VWSIAGGCAGGHVAGNGQCRNQLDAANKKIAELESTLKIEVSAKELATKRKDAFESVKLALGEALDDAEYEVSLIKGRLVVQLPNHIFFDSGKAVLKEEGKETLGKLAGALKALSERNFLVAGHTDNISIKKKSSKFKSNWALSTARALVVVEYLIEKGLEPSRLGAAGYGEYQPVADNGSEEGRAKNRRIELIIMPKFDEIPTVDDSPSETDTE